MFTFIYFQCPWQGVQRSVDVRDSVAWFKSMAISSQKYRLKPNGMSATNMSVYNIYIYIIWVSITRSFVLSVDCDGLLYAKMTFGEGWNLNSLKHFFGRKFPKVVRYMAIYVSRFSWNFCENFDKTWGKTAFSWKLGGLNCSLVLSCFQGDRGQLSP